MEDSYDKATVSGGSEFNYCDDYFAGVERDQGEYICELPEYTVPAPQQEVREREIFKPKKFHVSFWRRPVTKVYLNNFGFGVNGYQPMIDYLDAKDSGLSVSRDSIHLPYLEERCMNQYCATKPFNLYSNTQIDQLIDKGEKIRTQIRQNDAAGVSSILNRTHTNWSMTKKYVQLVKNSYVVDYRKLHSDSDQSNLSDSRSTLGELGRVPPNNITDIPKYISASDMESRSFIGDYIMSKMDHTQEMHDRRERLRALDDQYEESISMLASTVDKMRSRDNTITRVVTPQGNIYSTDQYQGMTEDALYRNRIKREYEMDRLCDDVDVAARHKYRSRNAIQFLGDEVTGTNAMALALARRNAIDAALARETANNWKAEHNFYGSSDRAIDERIDELRYKSSKMIIRDAISETPRRRIKVQDDIISPVQDRIINRAREMLGSTSENRRIKQRAKFMNVITPRPATGDSSLMYPPSKIERNICHMASRMAFGSEGPAARKYDIDDEMDEVPYKLSTNMIKTYLTHENDKPVDQPLSDSSGVRQATTRARERNALLGN